MKTAPNEPIGDYRGDGLTKREYFALHFATAIISNYRPSDFTGGIGQLKAAAIVDGCELADQLIENLNHTYKP